MVARRPSTAARRRTAIGRLGVVQAAGRTRARRSRRSRVVPAISRREPDRPRSSRCRRSWWTSARADVQLGRADRACAVELASARGAATARRGCHRPATTPSYSASERRLRRWSPHHVRPSGRRRRRAGGGRSPRSRRGRPSAAPPTPDRRAGRRRIRHERAVDGVDRREVADVGEEDRRLHDVVEAEPGRVEDRLEVAQRALGLGLDAVGELAGRRDRARAGPSRTRDPRSGSPGCTGPSAAGAPSVWIAWRVIDRSSRAVRWSQDRRRRDERRRRRPGRHERRSRSPARTRGRGDVRVVERRIERPQGRARARQPDRAAEEPGQRPAERHEARRRPPPRPAGGRWPRPARRPARGAAGRVSPEPNSLAKCSDVRRTRRPGSPIAPPAQAAKTAAVWAATAGVTSRTPGVRSAGRERGRPWSGVTRSPRPSTSAGAAGEEERHVAADRRRPARPARSSPSAVGRAPRLERAVDRGGGVAAAAGEARGDGDPLVEADRERRGASSRARATARRASRRSPGGRGCRRAGPGRSPRRGACRRPRRRIDREAQPVGQAERHHDRVQGVVAVGAATDDRERQVQLGRREPDDRGEAPRRVGRREVDRAPCAAGRADPDRSRRTPRAAPATPPPPRSGAGGPGRCRRPRARRRPGPAPRGAAASGRCGASSGAPGTPPGPGATARPRPRGVGQPIVVRVGLDDDHGADRRRAPARTPPAGPRTRSGPGRGTGRRPSGSSSGRAAPRSARRPRAGPSARAARAAASRRAARWRIGLVMWYGRFATTSYGGATSVGQVLVERVALDRAAAGRPRARSANRSREERGEARGRARPRSPRRRRRAGRRSGSPSPGPISRTRPPGSGAASARIASRTSGSARKFWDIEEWRARRPAARSVRRTAAGSTRGGAVTGGGFGGAVTPARRGPAAATAARRGRGRRARRRRTVGPPAAPIIAPLSVQSAGPRDDRAARPAPRPRPRGASRSGPFAATPPPSTIDRAPDRLGRPDRLRHEHVDDRVLEAPRELRGRVVGQARRPAVVAAAAAPRRPGPRRRSAGPRSSGRRS